jgi:hypothetical protein
MELVNYSATVRRRPRPLWIAAVLLLFGLLLFLSGTWIRAVGLMLLVDPTFEPWIAIGAYAGACLFWLWGTFLGTRVAVREDESYVRYTIAVILSLFNGVLGLALTVWMIVRVISRPPLQHF